MKIIKQLYDGIMLDTVKEMKQHLLKYSEYEKHVIYFDCLITLFGSPGFGTSYVGGGRQLNYKEITDTMNDDINISGWVSALLNKVHMHQLQKIFTCQFFIYLYHTPSKMKVCYLIFIHNFVKLFLCTNLIN